MTDRPPFRDRFLTAWAGLITSRPWLAWTIAVVLAGGAIAISVSSLEFRSDRSDLIDRSIAWQKRYADYKQRFERWNDAIIVADMRTEPEPGATLRFFEALESRLEADPQFDTFTLLLHRKELPSGLILIEKSARIERIVESLNRSLPALNAGSFAQLLRLASLGVGSMSPEARSELDGLLERAAHAAADPAFSVLDPGLTAEHQLMLSSTGHLALGMVSLHSEAQSVNADAGLISSLRGHVAEARDSARATTLEVGVTGVSVLESDETRQSMYDAALASGVSLVLISLLLIIVYRGVIVPTLAIVSLLLGVAWSFGWTTLAVGHLQVLSVVFAIVLLGLGIDAAIHLIARLELVHPDHEHMPRAVGRTFRGVGPGILTGVLTTAAAFAATALTDFSGVAEMGIIAAGGIILCAIAVMSCFPAALEILPHPERIMRDRHGGEQRPFAGRIGMFIDRHPRNLLIGSAVVIGGAAWLASGVRYDPDLIKLMPESSESVVWEKRLMEDDARTVWHAVAIADSPDQAAKMTRALRELPEVSDVGGAGMLSPNAAELARKQALLATMPVLNPPRPFDAGSVDAEALQGTVAALAQDTALPGANTLLLAMGQMGEEVAAEHIERAFARDRALLIERIGSLRTAELPPFAEWPESVRQSFVGTDGALLLRIYPNALDENQSILQAEHLGPFVSAVLDVAPSATGSAVQIYKSSQLITGAYARAALYASLVILLLLLIDFRHTGDALCALIPVVIGAILMLAIMRLANVPLNFANTIVMPLIIGLGVGDGVHIVHRWRQQPNDPPAGLAGGTGRAVGLTTLTTVIGFACMMLAEHRGIRSLGFVMSVGLTMVWLASIVLLPAVLRLRTAPPGHQVPDEKRRAHAAHRKKRRVRRGVEAKASS